MKIYQMNLNKKYSYCYVEADLTRERQKKYDLSSHDLCIWFEGESQKAVWFPRTIVQVSPLRGKKRYKPVGDFSSLVGFGAFFLRDTAVDVLQDMLAHEELLPVDCEFDQDYGKYVTVNVLTVLDCLDREHSKYMALPPREGVRDEERVLDISEYAFKKEGLQGHDLFKLKETPSTCFYVSQNFVDRVNEHGLTGFDFSLIWEG